jgi:mono/diheme cytochrome c family protein
LLWNNARNAFVVQAGAGHPFDDARPEGQDMTVRLIALVAALTLGGCAGEAVRQNGPEPVVMGSAERGGVLVRDKCAGCHAVERTGDSPLASAPPFHTMGVEYPISDLQEAFAEGLVTAHPAMPAFELQPTEIADLIAWLESVSGTGPGG